MMKKILVLVLLSAVINLQAAEKKKKEKTSAETIAELKAQLEAFEKVQLYEKYEREISLSLTTEPSNTIPSLGPKNPSKNASPAKI